MISIAGPEGTLCELELRHHYFSIILIKTQGIPHQADQRHQESKCLWIRKNWTAVERTETQRNLILLNTLPGSLMYPFVTIL